MTGSGSLGEGLRQEMGCSVGQDTEPSSRNQTSAMKSDCSVMKSVCEEISVQVCLCLYGLKIMQGYFRGVVLELSEWSCDSNAHRGPSHQNLNIKLWVTSER